MLAADGGPAEQVHDSYGYTWLVCKHPADDVSGLVTELHAVNSSLEAAGFGAALLCSVVGFTGEINGSARTLGLVYLYKRGTFYPFAPLAGQRRDNALELQLRGVIGADLKIEPDLSRWFPRLGSPRALTSLPLSDDHGWAAHLQPYGCRARRATGDRIEPAGPVPAQPQDGGVKTVAERLFSRQGSREGGGTRRNSRHPWGLVAG